MAFWSSSIETSSSIGALAAGSPMFAVLAEGRQLEDPLLKLSPESIATLGLGLDALTAFGVQVGFPRVASSAQSIKKIVIHDESVAMPGAKVT